jgi:2-iminobutanoate/2-iminopropanoate deaminase
MKKQIQVDGAPRAIGPYSQGVATGSTVYVSGQVPLDPITGELAQGIEAQAARCIENLRAVLAGEELTLDHVVKTTVFMTDLTQFSAMNEVYAHYFVAPYPARSAVQVAALPLGASVEIECIAHR